MNGVAASLHKAKKGPWPRFPLSTGVHKIENIKQAKEEVGVLSSFRFKEVSHGVMLMKTYFLGN